MPTRRVTREVPEETPKPRGRPATTPEAREQQMVALAFDVAEKQLRAGTASSQVITQLLKLGSSREMIEQERLRTEVAMNKAKMDALSSQKNMEVLYKQALEAMSKYSGNPMPPPDMEEDV